MSGLVSRSRANATAAERGADLRRDSPTVEELRAAHDYRSENRDLHDRGDAARPVDICRACGHEQDARNRGKGPACEVREVPRHLVETAKRHGLIEDGG